jgi:uncharacterized protein YidB (DUF937 family)
VIIKIPFPPSILETFDMSIFDLVTGLLSQGGGASSAQSPMAQVLSSLLTNPGGQQGAAPAAGQASQSGGLNMANLAAGAAGAMALVNMFKSSGLGDQVQSWLSTGSNQAIQGADIAKVFGQERIAQIAQTLGVDHHQASAQLAETLPNFIDKLSPNGELPQSADQFVALAKQFLGETAKSA